MSAAVDYDFDHLYDRASTDSLKWADRAKCCGSDDVLPLWVADMDFACPPEVVEAIKERAAHPIYGYPVRPETWYPAVASWTERRKGWKVDPSWIVYAPGVVPALNFAVQAYTRPGDKVVIQPPVYYPFPRAVLGNDRIVVENPLVLEGNRYCMDYEGLEVLIDSRTKMLILCSPHNPVGRVWDREELERLVEICSRRGLVLVSDEIHSDLILGTRPHTCAASISEEAARITVTLTAPNKTFNTAGLTMGCAIVPNPELRGAFADAVARSGIQVSNVFGNVALEAAYTKGEPWLEALLAYLRGNLAFLDGFIREKLPKLSVFPLEGTYLAWIDCRSLNLSDEELADLFMRKAGIWVDEGTMFGQGGSGFMRVNIACPRATLAEAATRLEKAIASI
jgi:cystathionine beta-lyase